MRYTTIIDVNEFEAVRRCKNAAWLYFQLVLRAGYHDYDRDIVKTSLRREAQLTGLTVDAVRHAVSVLESCKLLERKNGYFKVRKWIAEQPITPRKSSKKKEVSSITKAIDENEAYQARLREEQKARAAAELKADEEFIARYELYKKQCKDGIASITARAFVKAQAEKYKRELEKRKNS